MQRRECFSRDRAHFDVLDANTDYGATSVVPLHDTDEARVRKLVLLLELVAQEPDDRWVGSLHDVQPGAFVGLGQASHSVHRSTAMLLTHALDVKVVVDADEPKPPSGVVDLRGPKLQLGDERSVTLLAGVHDGPCCQILKDRATT